MNNINVRTKYINLVDDNGLLSLTELDDFLTWLHNNSNVVEYYYECVADNNGKPIGCVVSYQIEMDYTKNNYNYRNWKKNNCFYILTLDNLFNK